MLVRVAAFAALGGFLFGYDLGLIGGAMLGISDAFAITSTLTEEAIVGAAKLGAFAGTFVGGALMLRYGRRIAIAANSTFFTAGPLIMASAGGPGALVVGRLVAGLGIGSSAISVPAYLAEIAPTRQRGAVVQTYEMMLTMGMLLAVLVNWGLAATGSPNAWRWMVGLPALPGAAMGLGLLLLPESPRWLVLRGQLDAALGVIHKVLASKAVSNQAETMAAAEDELLLLWSSVEQDKAAAVERRQAVSAPPSRPPAAVDALQPGDAAKAAPAAGRGRGEVVRVEAVGGAAAGRAAPLAHASEEEGGGGGCDDEASAPLRPGGDGAAGAAAAAAAAAPARLPRGAGDGVDAEGGAGGGEAGARHAGAPAEPDSRRATVSCVTDAGDAGQGAGPPALGDDALGERLLPHRAARSGPAPAAAGGAAGARGGWRRWGGPRGGGQRRRGGADPDGGDGGVSAAASPSHSPPSPPSPGFESSFASTLWHVLADVVAVARGPERRALGIAAALAVFNQASASTSLLNYAPQVLTEQLGVSSPTSAILYPVVVSLTKCAGVAASFTLVDSLGRRPLLIGGGAACGAALVAAAAALALGSVPGFLASLCAFILSFSLSWAGLYWVLVSEMFSMAAKSPATSAATSLLFLTGAVVDLAFLSLVEGVGKLAFLLFAGVAFAGAVYVWAALPETKGRTIDEVCALLAAPAPAPALAGAASVGAAEGGTAEAAPPPAHRVAATSPGGSSGGGTRPRGAPPGEGGDATAAAASLAAGDAEALGGGGASRVPVWSSAWRRLTGGWGAVRQREHDGRGEAGDHDGAGGGGAALGVGIPLGVELAPRQSSAGGHRGRYGPLL